MKTLQKLYLKIFAIVAIAGFVGILLTDYIISTSEIEIIRIALCITITATISFILLAIFLKTEIINSHNRKRKDK